MAKWKWCVEDSNGKTVKGWYNDNGTWYYLNDEGIMQTGWIQDKDGRWYYLNSDGSMKTGWLKDSDGKWYYLQENSDGYKGSMYKDGTYTIDGKEYKFDKDGHMLENGVSDQCVNFVKGYEGYFDYWYDAGDGYDTIGYGTATSGKVGQRLKSQGITSCTEEEATGWLKEEINNMASSITSRLQDTGVTLKQCQFDALASFAYNCGTASLFSSTLWRYVISNKSAADIQTAFLMWNKCNGRTLEGLTKRRQAEANMYNYGVYNSNH